jgi:hypothetical protein
MGFRILADATVVLHLGFVLFVILGGLIVARWRRVVREIFGVILMVVVVDMIVRDSVRPVVERGMFPEDAVRSTNTGIAL